MNRNTRSRTRSLRPLVLGAAVAVALLSPGPASAHDLQARVNADADPVRVEAGFDDIPADGAAVTVTDATGTVVASGTTDDRGVWTFPRPEPGDYTIVVEGVGHRDQVRLILPATGGPSEVLSRFRFDKRVGLAAGLAGLLGLTALFARLRRSRSGERGA